MRDRKEDEDEDDGSYLRSQGRLCVLDGIHPLDLFTFALCDQVVSSIVPFQPFVNGITLFCFQLLNKLEQLSLSHPSLLLHHFVSLPSRWL